MSADGDFLFPYSFYRLTDLLRSGRAIPAPPLTDLPSYLLIPGLPVLQQGHARNTRSERSLAQKTARGLTPYRWILLCDCTQGSLLCHPALPLPGATHSVALTRELCAPFLGYIMARSLGELKGKPPFPTARAISVNTSIHQAPAPCLCPARPELIHTGRI